MIINASPSQSISPLRLIRYDDGVDSRFPVWLGTGWGDMMNEDDPPHLYEAIAAYEFDKWGSHFFLLMRVCDYREHRRSDDLRAFPSSALVRMPYEIGIGNRDVQVVPTEIALEEWKTARLVDLFADRRKVVELLKWVT